MKWALLALALSGCASDTDPIVQQPEPITPMTICRNLANICPEDPVSCYQSMQFVFANQQNMVIDLSCLHVTTSPEEARTCGYPCGGEVGGVR